jgi:hypothetical protein
MKCQHCHGFGRIAVFKTIMIELGPATQAVYRLEPCPECNGCGTTSCCGDSMIQPPKKEEVDE